MPLAVTPQEITLTGSETQTFQATLAGKPPVPSPDWEIAPGGKGSINKTTGVYTAPRWIPLSKTVTVTATSGTEFGTATVRLSSAHTWIVGLGIYWLIVGSALLFFLYLAWPAAPAPVNVLVSPPAVTLNPSDSQQFTANVPVNWPALAPKGLYSAPSAALTGRRSFEVTATSIADPKKTAKATVMLSPEIAIAVNPPMVTLRAGQSLKFEALSKKPKEEPAEMKAGVTWKIKPEVGTISAEGRYKAPESIAAEQTVLVIAKPDKMEESAAALVSLARSAGAEAQPPDPSDGPSTTTILLLVLLVGALGGALHGISSFADFVGNRQFVSNWGLWYLVRPYVGGVLAVIVYLALRSNLVSSESGASMSDIFKITAMAGLVGLFSDKAALKLKDVFETLFTPRANPRADALQGQAPNPKPRISGVQPPTVPRGTAPPPKLVISGSNFTSGCQVKVNGAARPVTSPSPTQLTVDLEAGDIAQPGSLKIVVVNPTGETSDQFTVTVT